MSCNITGETGPGTCRRCPNTFIGLGEEGPLGQCDNLTSPHFKSNCSSKRSWLEIGESAGSALFTAGSDNVYIDDAAKREGT